MEFRVLGTLAVEGPAGALDLGGRRQRSVVARLLVAGGDVVSVDRLIEDLWNGEPPPRALGSLQAFVSNLRRVLEPERAPRTPAQVLVSAAPGYTLRTSPDTVELTNPDFSRTLRIWMLADTGRADEARELAETRETPVLRRDWVEIATLLTVGEAAYAAGAPGPVAWSYERLSPFAGCLTAAATSFTLGPVDYYLGRWAGLLGDDVAAGEHLRRAAADAGREGLTYWAMLAEDAHTRDPTRRVLNKGRFGARSR